MIVESPWGDIETSAEGDRLYLTAPYAAKDAIKNELEGSKWDPVRRQWHCRNSNRTWFIINQAWKKGASWMRYKTDPPDVAIPPLRPGQPPYWPEQQQRGIQLYWKRWAIDTSDMGVGKTRSLFLGIELAKGHVRGYCDELEAEGLPANRACPIWWVSSKAGLKAFDKHRDDWQPGFRPEKTCTYDGLSRAISEAKRPPRIIVFDEVHALKNHKSARFKAALGLRELMEDHYGSLHWAFGATGTPAPNNYLDWWAVCEVIRPGFLKSGSYWKFRERYCNLIKSPYAKNVKVVDPENPWKDAIKKLPERLRPIAFGHSTEQCTVKLPTITFNRVHLPPSRALRRVAGAIARSGDTALQVLNRTRQLSDGYDPDTKTFVGTPKDGLLARLLTQHEEYRRFVVFANYRNSIDSCVENAVEMGWRVLRVDGRGWYSAGDMPATQRAFTDVERWPHPTCVVAHPRSGGEGVDFSASRSALFYSNGFSAGDRMQAVKRIHRPGQEHPVNIYDALHLATDGYVLDVLNTKEKNLKWSLDVIRGLFVAEEVMDEPSEFEADSWLEKMRNK